MKQPAEVRGLPQAGLQRARGAGRSRRASAERPPGPGAHPLLGVRLPPWRSKMLLFALFCAFLALTGRAFYLQGGASTRFLQQQGEVRYARTLDVAANRGAITDRNGVVLASSVPARAVWAIPDDFEADVQRDLALARLLAMSPEELHRRLAEADRGFVYLRRQVDPELADRIEALQAPGVHTSREFRRQYAEGPITAHLLGFTDVEDHGLEGVEREFDATLRGRPGRRHLIKDRLGHAVEDDWLREPVEGHDLALSIDDRIQYVAWAALRSAAETQQARAASAVVLDVRSGELLALANWPGYDPARRGQDDPEHLRDRAVTDTFEPGSTLKPFSIATALEAGLVTPGTEVDTLGGRLPIGGRVITDDHRHGILTVEQVVAKSSNVGTARIALGLPAQALWDTLTAVGFGQAPRIGLAGAVPGRLRPAASWRPVEQATIAYGYGVSVSLMQLAHAYLVFARDGDLVPVSVQRLAAMPAGVQVLRPETARAVRHMLQLATSDEGTAPAARIAGYGVAGKTGTARKLRDGHYVDAYVASFVGFAPAAAPRVVVAVMIDEPRAGRYYGGEVAAPVFAAIMSGTLRALQVTPDAAQQVAAVGGAG